MLEWYAAGFDYHQLMDSMRSFDLGLWLEIWVLPKLFGKQKNKSGAALGKKLPFADAFTKYAPVTLDEALV